MSAITAAPTLTWPPPYSLRFSARAKTVSLSISPKRGLEIVIPAARIRKPNIDALLLEKRSWIEKHLTYLQRAEQYKAPLIKPIVIDLRAIGQVFTLSYIASSNKHIKIKSNPDQTNALEIIGPITNDQLIFAALHRWLKLTAEQYLTPWLTNLSKETGLCYSGISIRSQSTLWGSCTAAKKISLNKTLLFLPDYLVRYILLHELCHTKYLNHSKRYWELLKTVDPLCRTHRKMMREVGHYIPRWIEMK